MRRSTTLVLSLTFGLLAFIGSGLAVALTSPLPRSKAPVIPTLTKQQRTDIASMVRTSVFVHYLVRKLPNRLTKIEVWTDSKAKLLGGVATLIFPHPVSITSTFWIALDYDCSERNRNALAGAVPYSAARTHVSSLKVWVDLRRGVVGIDPDRNSGLATKSQIRGLQPGPPPRHGYQSTTCAGE